LKIEDCRLHTEFIAEGEFSGDCCWLVACPERL
jgi:hypothetical protein